MANGFLNIPSLTSEVSRENPYLNSEFGVDWSSMGLNNLNTVYDNNNGGGFNNFMGSTVGNNYSGALGSIIGTGLTLWGGYKSYKTYKNLKYDDYKNELAFTQIDIDRENTMQSLYRNNAQIMAEATSMINYNAYMQSMENQSNQSFNEQAYQNSIFNVSRQAKQKSNEMYKNLQTLDLNVQAAKNAEEVSQKMNYLYAKQTTFNAFRQSLNNTIGTVQDYMSQISMMPMFNRNSTVKADTSLVDSFNGPASVQLSTTKSKLEALKMNGFELSQNYLAQGNKVMIGQFQASLGKEYVSPGLNRTDYRVPNFSEVYFNFDE